MKKFNIKAWQDKHDTEGVTKGGIINKVESSTTKQTVGKKTLITAKGK